MVMWDSGDRNVQTGKEHGSMGEIGVKGRADS